MLSLFAVKNRGELIFHFRNGFQKVVDGILCTGGYVIHIVPVEPESIMGRKRFAFIDRQLGLTVGQSLILHKCGGLINVSKIHASRKEVARWGKISFSPRVADRKCTHSALQIMKPADVTGKKAPQQ